MCDRAVTGITGYCPRSDGAVTVIAGYCPRSDTAVTVTIQGVN